MVTSFISSLGRRNSGHSDPEIASVNRITEPSPSAPVYAASVVVNCLSLALPLFILQIYDRIIPNAAYNTLALMGFGLIIVIMVDSTLRCLRGNLMSWHASAYVHNASMTALRQMLASGPRRNESAQPCMRLSQFNAIASLGEHHGGNAPIAMIDVCFIPIFLGVIALVGGPIVLTPIIMFCAFAYFAFKRTKRLGAFVGLQEVEESRRTDFVAETLRSMHTIKTNAMEPLMLRRFERLQSGSSATLKSIISLNLGAVDTGALYATFSTAAVVFVGALLTMNGQLTIGGLAACTLLSSQLLQPVLRFITSQSAAELAQQKRALIGDLLSASPVQALHMAADKSATPTARPLTAALSNVTIRLDDGRAIFSNVTARFDAGRIIAIRGPDGSGRTSLLKTICGDIKPSRGAVRICGDEIGKSDQPVARRLIQYVDQTPVIFRGTILENLTLFELTSVAAALEAAGQTGLDEQINRMPQGFDTAIRSPSGRDLPAALSQQICITRALAAKPSILLLDEANTALDALAEARLTQLLKTIHGDITIVIASHRPSIVSLADDIFDICDGSLILAADAGSDLLRRAS